MVSESYDENTKVTSIKTYYNFLNKNNYFLKSSARTNGKEAGDSFIGTNYIAVRTEMNGTKSPVSMAQQYGMSHSRMQLPTPLCPRADCLLERLGQTRRGSFS